MGAIVGMIIGYILGTRAGEKGFQELEEAWKTISSSEEVKDLVVGGMSLVGDFARQGRGLLVERLSAGDEPGRLSSVA